jgi:hypothetical protein
VIDAEAAALFESGRSLIVCTIDEQGMPDATRAWAIKVLDGGNRMRISISDDAHQAIENLGATGRLAITGTHVIELTSRQAKGRVDSELGPESSEDRVRRSAQLDEFVERVHEADGAPYETINRVRPRSFVVFEMLVDEVFDQTPGPAAGRQVAPVPS